MFQKGDIVSISNRGKTYYVTEVINIMHPISEETEEWLEFSSSYLYERADCCVLITSVFRELYES